MFHVLKPFKVAEFIVPAQGKPGLKPKGKAKFELHRGEDTRTQSNDSVFSPEELRIVSTDERLLLLEVPE